MHWKNQQRTNTKPAFKSGSFKKTSIPTSSQRASFKPYKFWQNAVKTPLSLKDRYFEPFTGQNLETRVSRSPIEPRVLWPNSKRRQNLITGKFMGDMYTQFQFDDQLFRYRVKERLWSHLMVAKRSGLAFFLDTCRNFAKNTLLGRHPGLNYMLDYFHFISLYLRNDFLCFAVTKFLYCFKNSWNLFFQYKSSIHALFLKKTRSIRDSLLTKRQAGSFHFKFFVIFNSFAFCLFRLFQFFWAMFIFRIPYLYLFNKPQLDALSVLRPSKRYLKSVINYERFRFANYDKLPVWQQEHVLHIVGSDRFRQINSLHDILNYCGPRFKRILPWADSLWVIPIVSSDVPKPRFDFPFWEQVDQTFNRFEFSTQIYTARPFMFVHPLSDLRAFGALNEFNDFFFFWFFARSLVTFFGAAVGAGLYGTVLSPGYFYTLCNTCDISVPVWTVVSNFSPSYFSFGRYWDSFILPVFFDAVAMEADFFAPIRDRTRTLVQLPYFTKNTFLQSIAELFQPWANYFDEASRLLPKAFGTTRSEVLTIFDWFDRMASFTAIDFAQLFPIFATQQNKQHMSFPLIFPNERDVETTTLPYMDFAGVRFRRKVAISQHFARKYNLRFFLKFMTVLIKQGFRKRAVKLMSLSLQILKRNLACLSARRVFIGAGRQMSTDLVLAPITRGGKSYHVFLLARIQRLWSNGVKALGHAVAYRRLDNWQEKNYNYAWALADEVLDVMQLKYDCFAFKFLRAKTRFMTEMRRYSTRRRGLTIGNNDPYRRLHELRVLASPKTSSFNEERYQQSLSREQQRAQKTKQRPFSSLARSRGFSRGLWS